MTSIAWEKRRGRIASAWLVAVLMGLTTACGGAGDDDPGGTDAEAPAAQSQAVTGTDPCTLLTAEDAQRALGRPVERTDPDNIGGLTMCQYMAENSESVTLQLQPGAPSDFDTYVKQSVDMLGATTETVTGVGDRAMLVGDQFLFTKGSTMYILLLGTFASEGKMDTLRELAAAVLART